MRSNTLTDKQLRFAEEYLIDLNATQAAIRAGYSKKTANEQGARLLAKVSITEYLTERKQQVNDKLQITYERTMQEYARLAFFDIRKIYDDNGALKEVKDLDDDTAAALAGIESVELNGPEGISLGTNKKVKTYDKKGALDSICKVNGWNAPAKIEATGANGQPLIPTTLTVEIVPPKQEV